MRTISPGPRVYSGIAGNSLVAAASGPAGLAGAAAGAADRRTGCCRQALNDTQASSASAMLKRPFINHLLVRFLIRKQQQRGLQHDPEVQRQRPVVEVVEVVVNALLHLVYRLGLAAEAVDLGPAGYARPHLV